MNNLQNVTARFLGRFIAVTGVSGSEIDLDQRVSSKKPLPKQPAIPTDKPGKFKGYYRIEHVDNDY